MSASLYVFTGENTFQVREERKLWVNQFALKHGEENISVIDGSNAEFRTFLDYVSIAPLFAPKRLFVVEGIPSFSKEEAESLLTLIHPDCVVVIVDSKPDRRLSGVKAFLKLATTKEFKPLQRNQLRLWMEQYAVRQGTSLSRDAVDALLEIVGENQDMLSMEIEKLAVFCGSRAIGSDDVRLLAVPSGEREVWQLTSLISAGKGTESLRYARELVSGGEDPMALWNILLWFLRNLVYVYASVQEGRSDAGRIASQYRVPMQTVYTLLPFAKRIPHHLIKDLVSWAAETEIERMRGGYRYTREAPQEILSLIDRLILSATSRSS